MVTKIWLKNSDKQSAMNFYYSFWESTNLQPEDFSDQLKTLVMIRCVGFTDELITEPNQYHNTKLKLSQKLADNIEDVINLELLMILAYNKSLCETPFVGANRIPLTKKPKAPFEPDMETVQQLLMSGGTWY